MQNIEGEEIIMQSVILCGFYLLQSFGNIPVTGVIDSETKKLIKSPRCGVGDNNHSLSFSPDNLHHGRMKRYVLQGPKWDKTDLTWR